MFSRDISDLGIDIEELLVDAVKTFCINNGIAKTLDKIKDISSKNLSQKILLATIDNDEKMLEVLNLAKKVVDDMKGEN